MIKRTCKTRKNPSVASDLITTSIKKVGARYQLSVFVGSTELFKLTQRFESYEDANKAAGIAKSRLVKELEKSKRKNPRESSYQLENSFKQAIGSSIGLPDDKASAFELGRLYGIQTSLENYCGALNYLRRRSILKTINREISDALGVVARKVAVRGEGIEGPIPFVKKMSSKN
jgi:hypothetical protein